eukprot:scaffold219719_cov26-Tisochrysis_lutea.AAC.1
MRPTALVTVVISETVHADLAPENSGSATTVRMTSEARWRHPWPQPGAPRARAPRLARRRRRRPPPRWCVGARGRSENRPRRARRAAPGRVGANGAGAGELGAVRARWLVAEACATAECACSACTRANKRPHPWRHSCVHPAVESEHAGDVDAHCSGRAQPGSAHARHGGRERERETGGEVIQLGRESCQMVKGATREVVVVQSLAQSAPPADAQIQPKRLPRLARSAAVSATPSFPPVRSEKVCPCSAGRTRP